MKHLKKHLMMTLALLITAATSAWAAESKPIGLNVEYEVGDVITSTTAVYVRWGTIINISEGTSRECVIKITDSSSKWPTIQNLRCDGSYAQVLFDEISFEVFYQDNGESTETDAQFIVCVGECSGDLDKVHVASGSGTLADPYVFAPGPGSSGNAFPIIWDAETPNTASIAAMPAGNVTVNVKYFAQAELATSTGETPELLAPAAIAGVPANTDGPIVTAGTVANIGTSEVKQGTLKYFVSQTAMSDAELQALTPDKWSENVPTANGLAEGKAYVWYYIEGAEPAQGTARTDDNTRSDSDIMPLGTSGFVTLAAEPEYTVSLNKTDLAEGEPALWKAKSTNVAEVILGTKDLEGVKKSETVTVTYSGTKKIIGVKAEKKSASTPLDNTTTAWTAGTFAVPAGGLIYNDAITVSGDVTLVLTDDETLTLNKGISLASGATLTIQGNGTMNVNGTNESTASTVAGSGTIILTSGTLNAKGGNGGSVGGNHQIDLTANAGGVAINGAVTVNGGTLTATGGNGGSVTGDMLIECKGGAGGAAISGDLTVNSGTMTTTNGTNGSVADMNFDCTAGASGKAVAGTVIDNRL